jgi:hypothetical protein
MLVVPANSTSESVLTYVSCGGFGEQPAEESPTPAFSQVNYQQPATEDSAISPPQANEPSPANVEEAAETAVPAAALESKGALEAELPAEAIVEVVESDAAATPSLRVLDLDKSLGKQRIGVMLGLIAAVLIGLRFVSNRVGAPTEN